MRSSIRGIAIIGEHCTIDPNTYIGPYTNIGDHTIIRKTNNRTNGRTRPKPSSNRTTLVALNHRKINYTERIKKLKRTKKTLKGQDQRKQIAAPRNS